MSSGDSVAETIANPKEMALLGEEVMSHSTSRRKRDFPGDPVAETLLPVQGTGFDRCSRNWVPHATAKSSHAALKILRPTTKAR